MALVTFKDLCLDANDPARLGRFWAELLGLELHLQDNGDAYLTGPTPQHTIWATVVDADSFRWTLMADPEGGEFCVFVREGEITERLYEIGVDTGGAPEHAMRIAAWWADILGAHAVDSERGFSYVEDIPGAPFESIDFAPVPEAKTVKNRIHPDVTTADLDALVAAGATVLRPRDEEIAWTVLADPDGNEFCAFPEDPRG